MKGSITVKEDPFKIDRSAFSVISIDEQLEDEKRYWRSKTPHERLEAVELTRQILYGYDPATARLQRVLEVARRV
jgi:hypothetical protein